MRRHSEAAWERAMKVQEVILRTMAKRITCWQAAEILGISDRSLRRWKRRALPGMMLHLDGRVSVAGASTLAVRPGEAQPPQPVGDPDPCGSLWQVPQTQSGNQLNLDYS